MERSDSQKLASIEALLESMDHRLFGNGQPGEIDRLHGKIGKVDARVTKLENWRWWVVGIGVGLGVATGAGLRSIAEHLIGAK